MSYKRPVPSKNGGPPEKRSNQTLPTPPEKRSTQTLSSIQGAMMNQKVKQLEQGYNERGMQLAKKQQELNDANKKMEEMQLMHDTQIFQFRNLMEFQNEERKANAFDGSKSKDLSSSGHGSTRTSFGTTSGVQPKPLGNTSNLPHKKPKPSTEDEKLTNLMLNIFVRKLGGGAGLDMYSQYKIDSDKILPVGFTPDEMVERFQTIRDIHKKQPARTYFDEHRRVPSRKQVLEPVLLETDDRDDRVSIWMALNSEKEHFLYQSPVDSKKKRRMRTVIRNFEYAGAYDGSTFESLSAPDYIVPNWFSHS